MPRSRVTVSMRRIGAARGTPRGFSLILSVTAEKLPYLHWGSREGRPLFFRDLNGYSQVTTLPYLIPPREPGDSADGAMCTRLRPFQGGNDGRERALQEGHRDPQQADGRQVRREHEQVGVRRPDHEEVRRLRPRGGVRHAVGPPRPRPQDQGADLRDLRYRPGALARARDPSAHGA